MESSWNDCLQLIRQKVGEHIYEVWFSQISMESYDEATNTVLLRVPHRYVYEYLEEVQVATLTQVLADMFRPGIKLNYRIDTPAAEQKHEGPGVVAQSHTDSHIAIPNARERLQRGLEHFLGKDKMQWLPGYDDLVSWLTDNKGRGLLLVGTSGLGKSLICQKILPVLLGKEVTIVSAREMNKQIDTLLQQRIIIIDDLGKESVEEWVNYEKRTPFFELCDAAEQRGILMVINTNLSTNTIRNPKYPYSIEGRYGTAVLDRLRSTVSVVEFEGDSMRH